MLDAIWPIVAIVLIAVPLVLVGVIIEGAAPVQYTPMSYDEEMEWLIYLGEQPDA
jgi:hypothetical protein